MVRIESALKLLALFAGLLAVLMYGVLVVAYNQFYGILGVPIEEVGRSRLDLLPEVLAGPILILVTDFWARFTFLLVILAGVGVISLSEFRRLERERAIMRGTVAGRVARARQAFWRLRTRRIAAGCGYTLAAALLASVGLGIYGLGGTALSLASSYGKDVRVHGRSVTGVFKHEEDLEFPLLDVQALPAEVDWKGPDPPASLVANPECLMYLGQNDGRIVLYDVRAQAVVRYDAADAVLTVFPNTEREEDQVPSWCRRP